MALASMAVFSRMTWISPLQTKKGEEKERGGAGVEEDGKRRWREEGKGRRKKDEKNEETNIK